MPHDCHVSRACVKYAWHQRRTPVRVVRSAYGAIYYPYRLRRQGLVQAGLFRRLLPSGGRLNRACDPGDTHRLRSGRPSDPNKDGVNPDPPAVRRGLTNSPVSETRGGQRRC